MNSSCLSNCDREHYLSHVPSAVLQKRWVSLAVTLACLVLKTARWEKSMMCNLVSNGHKCSKEKFGLHSELMSEENKVENIHV